MIGTLSNDILDSLFETIPFEFSVIDANDKVLAWNKHDTRIFKRPAGVIGRDVRNCHPNKSVHLVEKILDEMKSRKRDFARFWIDLALDSENKEKKSKILIEYYALRDKSGNYLGCLELTRNITEIQKLSGEKRLLDG
jgi:DUF438 domain-containing protein